jgi:hypothetical protein
MSFDFRSDLLCSLNVSEHALPVPVIHDLLITGEKRAITCVRPAIGSG